MPDSRIMQFSYPPPFETLSLWECESTSKSIHQFRFTLLQSRFWTLKDASLPIFSVPFCLPTPVSFVFCTRSLTTHPRLSTKQPLRQYVILFINHVAFSSSWSHFIAPVRIFWNWCPSITVTVFGNTYLIILAFISFYYNSFAPIWNCPVVSKAFPPTMA